MTAKTQRGQKMEEDFMAALLNGAIDMASSRLTFSSSFGNGDMDALYTTIKSGGSGDSPAQDTFATLDGGYELITTGTWKSRSERSYSSDDWSGQEKNLHQIAIRLRIANRDHPAIVGADSMPGYDYVFSGKLHSSFDHATQQTEYDVDWEKVQGTYFLGSARIKLPQEFWDIAVNYPAYLFGFKATKKLDQPTQP